MFEWIQRDGGGERVRTNENLHVCVFSYIPSSIYIYIYIYIYTINNKYVLKYTSILSWQTCDRTTVVETYFDWFLKRGERSDSVWISNEIKMCSFEYNWRSVVQVIARRWIPYLLYKSLLKLKLLPVHSSNECEAGKVKCELTLTTLRISRMKIIINYKYKW